VSVIPLTSAQDGTPLPALTLTPEPVASTMNDPLVMALPFGDTFDTNCCWQAVGAWQFDPDTAYEGGGWFADGSVREILAVDDPWVRSYFSVRTTVGS